MRNAVAIELGEEQPKYLGSKEKQFIEAKEKLEKNIGNLPRLLLIIKCPDILNLT